MSFSSDVQMASTGGSKTTEKIVTEKAQRRLTLFIRCRSRCRAISDAIDAGIEENDVVGGNGAELLGDGFYVLDSPSIDRWPC